MALKFRQPLALIFLAGFFKIGMQFDIRIAPMKIHPQSPFPVYPSLQQIAFAGEPLQAGENVWADGQRLVDRIREEPDITGFVYTVTMDVRTPTVIYIHSIDNRGRIGLLRSRLISQVGFTPIPDSARLNWGPWTIIFYPRDHNLEITDPG